MKNVLFEFRLKGPEESPGSICSITVVLNAKLMLSLRTKSSDKFSSRPPTLTFKTIDGLLQTLAQSGER